VSNVQRKFFLKKVDRYLATTQNSRRRPVGVPISTFGEVELLARIINDA
jgi:hypothetical protein